MEFEEFRRRMALIQRALVERASQKTMILNHGATIANQRLQMYFKRLLAVETAPVLGEQIVLSGFMNEVVDGHSTCMMNSLMQRLKNSAASMTLWILFHRKSMVSLR